MNEVPPCETCKGYGGPYPGYVQTHAYRGLTEETLREVYCPVCGAYLRYMSDNEYVSMTGIYPATG